MKLTIYFDNLQEKYPITFRLKRLIRKTVKAALRYEKFAFCAEVSVTFTDNPGIRTLNREHRELDKETDVLSFPLYDFRGGEEILPGEPAALGDIVLSLEKAASQAEEFGHSYEREVAFLTAHSVLHLLGYDHELSESDDEDMRRRQREILESIRLTK